MLAQSLILSRDLGAALAARIASLSDGSDPGGDAQAAAKDQAAVKAYQAALTTVLHFGASVDKHSQAESGDERAALDLAEARAEILARLARFAADG